MNIVICDYIEQYCKEIDKIIWNMADEFEEHINVVSFNSVQELYKYRHWIWQSLISATCKLK